MAAGIQRHVTQRGNARRFILDCDTGREVYLNLLRENLERSQVRLLGYCLMHLRRLSDAQNQRIQ